MRTTPADNRSTEDIRSALKELFSPMDRSLHALNEHFGDFKLSTASSLTEIKTDLKHMRGQYKDLNEKVEDIRSDWPVVIAHVKRAEDTGSFNIPTARDIAEAKALSNGNIKVTLPKSIWKYIVGIFIGALLGAAVVGAMLVAGGSSGEAVNTVKKAVQQPANTPPSPASLGNTE